LQNSPYGLLAFSLVAGFSEKYVPEILEKMEQRRAKVAEDDGGASADGKE
jgi:hypothetical protein